MIRPTTGREGQIRPLGFLVLFGSLSVVSAAPAQTITEYSLPVAESRPNDIVTGPDGALWFTEAGKIGRITTGGAVTEFPVPADVGGPGDIAVGPDGALWFTLCNVYLHEPVSGGSKIGRISVTGEIQTYAVPSKTGCPVGITAGPDGNLWFAELFAAKLARITPSGTVTEFPLPQGGAPGAMVAGADGSLWFSSTTLARQVVGRISTSGEIVEFLLSGKDPRCPNGLTVGPDGEIWFAEGCSSFGAAVSRITPSGTVTTFPLPSPSCGSEHITTGPDGALWFTESSGNKIGRMTPDGTITEFPLPSANSYPSAINAGPDNAIWFTEWGIRGNRIGRITVPGIAYSTVRLDPTETSLGVGETRGITATLGIAGAMDTSVTLTASEPGIVLAPASVVMPAGQAAKSFDIVGIGPGATRITARLGDGTVSEPVAVTVTAPAPLTTQVRLVPIVLDVTTPIAHYTTELTLTNTTASPITALLTYTASLGDRDGSGTVSLDLAAGEQLIIADVISDLRTRGLAIPDRATGPQGGTLLVAFYGDRELPTISVGALARTTTATAAPQPVGSAGLAYLGLAPQEAITRSATLFGLRADESDRSNVALFNTGFVPVSVKVTLKPGTGGTGTTFRESEVLPPYGWVQYNSSDLLGVAGLSNAYVKVERVSAEGTFGAYAVINDNTTSDGSFLLLAGEGATGTSLAVPVLVETPSFRSELVLTNCGTATATLQMRYVESNTPSLGAGGTTTIELPAGRQLIVPDAVDFLRGRSVAIGPKGQMSYVGSLRIAVSGVPAGEIFAAARTGSQSPAGGQFGLFTPAVRDSAAATNRALLLGLRDDDLSRSNAAIVNVGTDGAGSVTLSLQARDGDFGGIPRGEPEVATLSPGTWKQWGRFLDAKGVRNGWIEVTRTAGTAPWIAYGVINDGASPGDRTGDGAYVPMVIDGNGPTAVSPTQDGAIQIHAAASASPNEEK